MRCLLLPAYLALLVAAVSLNTGAGAGLAPAREGTVRLTVQDDDVAQVQQMLSKRREWTRPAPRVWSSRHDVRWSARWQAAPRYAV
jgi:hypothetical protein